MRFVHRFLLVVLVGACGSGGSSHHVSCTYQSNSSSGGLCRADYQCADGHRGVSCDDTDCVCLAGDNDTPGVHFPANGFCASASITMQGTFEAHCLGGDMSVGP